MVEFVTHIELKAGSKWLLLCLLLSINILGAPVMKQVQEVMWGGASGEREGACYLNLVWDIDFRGQRERLDVS